MSISCGPEIRSETERRFSPIAYGLRCYKLREIERSTHSAYIASVLTSLIATCLYAGINAVEYLVALQEHRADVWTDPAAWLPWAYARSRASP